VYNASHCICIKIFHAKLLKLGFNDFALFDTSNNDAIFGFHWSPHHTSSDAAVAITLFNFDVQLNVIFT